MLFTIVGKVNIFIKRDNEKMNTFLKKFSLFHYNIGFFPFNTESLLKGSVKVRWMKHDYKDCFFADPFILSVSENEIKVLVEDFPYNEWKGNISLLVVDKESFTLKRKKTLLQLETHLSFPFILRDGKHVYVVPENSASGKLIAYQYKNVDEKLERVTVLTEMPVIDPVIVRTDKGCRLYGSIRGKNENGALYEWESDRLLGSYQLVTDAPVKIGNNSSRRAGDFFLVEKQLYAATQCCEHSYGEAMNICRVDSMERCKLCETIVSTIVPQKEYSDGLHTLNIHQGICVVDGLTYLFRPIEKIKMNLRNRK